MSAIPTLESALVHLLAPLAIWIAISGLDDLFLLYAWCVMSLRKREVIPAAAELAAAPQRLIAIFVPLWQEHAVIEHMVQHNNTAIRYGAFHFFVGCYPNDIPTVDAVQNLESRFPNVHMAVVPHDGPTSKADCLNWVYQTMLLNEERQGHRFELLMIHDAEDLIHPDSLRWVNYYASHYDMIQVPVLPLPTPARDLVHGIYIDEFSEFQTRDLQVRQWLGGFVPSSGVGTAFSRASMEALALQSQNRVFEPACLTEDYELGFRLHELGFRQHFMPIRSDIAGPIATREFFPRTLRSAIRQRTRWATGIVWQGWERHGWGGGPKQWYWHWRDRKGILGNPASVLANLLLAYGAVTAAVQKDWTFGHRIAASGMEPLLAIALLLTLVQLAARMAIVRGHYGFRMAALAPLRIFLANWINAQAGIAALLRYARSRTSRTALVWLKTQHQYPNRFALEAHRPTLEEVLVKSAYLSEEVLAVALASKPQGVRMQDHLVRSGALSEEDLYEALSLQLCIPLSAITPSEVSSGVARALPADISRKWNVVPVEIRSGSLVLAAAEEPPEEMHHAVQGYTRLNVQLELVTRSTFDELQRLIA